MAAVLLGDRRVVVETSDEVLLAERGWYTEGLRRLPDGTLVVRGHTWRDPEGPPRLWLRISTDGGRTWVPPPASAPDAGPDYALACNPLLLQRRDGRVIGWAGVWNLTTEYRGRPGQPTVQTVVQAANWDALLYGPRATISAPIYIPYMTPLVGDDLRTRYTPALWGQMIETEDGHLIQATYPVLASDRSPRLWENQMGFAPQYRTIVIYSQDDGATWHYLATVAAADRYPLPPQAEGYCEPDLLYFGNGHLICIMRSGGNPAGFLQERYTPLMVSHSYDGGLSWEPPYPIAAHGVKPVLLSMSNGLIACLAGRPGFFLLFSADQGRTWSTPHWISQQHGPWGESPTRKGALLELEPGVLAISYDEYSSIGSEARMVSKWRRCRIEVI
jgi:hypothetical protein